MAGCDQGVGAQDGQVIGAEGDGTATKRDPADARAALLLDVAEQFLGGDGPEQVAAAGRTAGGAPPRSSSPP
ncbi:hypothetical protein [Streptomyces sp. NPDC004629]|uniref:hypothetical protein n=1 Tax=Streptomyces sp. NPDC004629 TaxID=3364705 RepID=UPI0036B6AA38